MKLNDIKSSRLPGITDSIKECVNMGEWLLYKIEPIEGNQDAAFYLKTPTHVFQLSDNGEILREIEDDADNIGEIFYFSDISKPTTLSNMTAF